MLFHILEVKQSLLTKSGDNVSSTLHILIIRHLGVGQQNPVFDQTLIWYNNVKYVTLSLVIIIAGFGDSFSLTTMKALIKDSLNTILNPFPNVQRFLFLFAKDLEGICLYIGQRAWRITLLLMTGFLVLERGNLPTVQLTACPNETYIRVLR